VGVSDPEDLTETETDPTVAWPPPQAPGAPRPTTPTHIAGYELLGVLGRGGVGVVHRGRHLSLGKEVAIKLLAVGSEKGVARFLHEARAMAELTHPNLLPVHDVGQEEGRWFIVMDLVTGGDLSSLVDEALKARAPGGGGPVVPLERALTLLEKTARAIAHAHERGIIHRDLKPSNVLLRPDGEPVVADFGLARRLETPQGITRSGEVLGTPAYMAPEQASLEGTVDERSDVYALGAILYQLLTGRPPVLTTGNFVVDVMAVMNHDVEQPRRTVPSLPREVETIVLRCLERDPGARYPTALALADDVRRYRAGEPILARPPSAAARALRWVRRRRTPLALVGLAGLLLLTVGALAAELSLSWRRWELVAESEFEVRQDLESWSPLSGEWRVEGGALEARGGSPAMIALLRPVPGDVRVELEARLDAIPGHASGDLSVVLLPEGSSAIEEGYFFGFGSNANTHTKLLRRGSQVATADVQITPGRLHSVLVERAGNRLRLAVDGEDVLVYEDPQPLDLGRGTRVVLYTWDSLARFERVRVSQRPGAYKARRQDVADWLLQQGEPAAAARLYADVARDPSLALEDQRALVLPWARAELAAAIQEGPEVSSERLARAAALFAEAGELASTPAHRAQVELGLAEVDLLAGRIQAALARVRRVVEEDQVDPQGARAVLGRADALFAGRGDLAAREAVLRESLALFGGPQAPALDVELTAALAHPLRDQGRQPEAVALLEQALDRYREHPFHGPTLLIELALTQHQIGRAERARELLQETLARPGLDDAHRAEALFVLTELWLQAGDMDAAQRLLDRAHALGRSADEVAYHQAVLSLRRGTSGRAACLATLDALSQGTGVEDDGMWMAGTAASDAALARVLGGDAEEARARLAACVETWTGPLNKATAGALLLGSLLDLRAGDGQAARSKLRALEQRGVRAPRLRALGQALLDERLAGEAEAWLARAGDSARERGVVSFALGVVVQAGGHDQVAARGYLEAAAAEEGAPTWARELARYYLGR
jgi:tetratricopeptide (TPR) repeat protein